IWNHNECNGGSLRFGDSWVGWSRPTCGSDYWPGVMILNVSDRAHPIVEQQTALKGRLITSRLADGRLYVVSSDTLVAPIPQSIWTTEPTLLRNGEVALDQQGGYSYSGPLDTQFYSETDFHI